jgi:hypothetical protein
MTTTRKWVIIVLLLAVLGGLAVLAAAVPRLNLERGQYFQMPKGNNPVVETILAASAPERRFLMLRSVLTLIVILYPIYILLSLLTRRGRQRLVKDLARLTFFIILLLWFNKNGEKLLSGIGPAELQSPDLGNELLSDLPVAVFNPNTPSWIPIALLLLGALLAALVAGSIAWWYLPERRRKQATVATAQKIAEQADQALQAIQAGEEVEDVILRTYYQMEETLSEERGLTRPQAMTPGEFAEALGRQGVPSGAVHDLTQLFEAVRYGGAHASPAMQKRATNALQAIALGMPG